MQQEDSRGDYPPVWSHLGLNQGPPDYESGATNQLSYGTPKSFLIYNFKFMIYDLLFAARHTVEDQALLFGNLLLFLGKIRNDELHTLVDLIR